MTVLPDDTKRQCPKCDETKANCTCKPEKTGGSFVSQPADKQKGYPPLPPAYGEDWAKGL